MRPKQVIYHVMTQMVWTLEKVFSFNIKHIPRSNSGIHTGMLPEGSPQKKNRAGGQIDAYISHFPTEVGWLRSKSSRKINL